jgi:hypothetical protein
MQASKALTMRVGRSTKEVKEVGKGRGIVTWRLNGSQYRGQLNPENHKPEGYGEHEMAGGTYSGQFADGDQDGYGVFCWASGDKNYYLYDRGKEVHRARELSPTDPNFADVKGKALQAQVHCHLDPPSRASPRCRASAHRLRFRL